MLSSFHSNSDSKAATALPMRSMKDVAPRKLAVRGYDLCLAYKLKDNENLYALNHLTINIPAGTIYGLLGPSGSGKTSLLRVITGLTKPNTGTISVFGFKPGQQGSGIPGSGIGYMPQEASLLDDLTVSESLYYFGRLYFLPREELKARVDSLVDFLEIPDKNQLVANLSGGQQRRLSLACAVVHRPRLAILDEPTVGIDPFLCAKVWELLKRLCFEDKMTIIITTHYIEECRKAAVVGFMRAGAILVEDRPESVLRRQNCGSLEEAFLKICLDCKARRKSGNSLIASYFSDNQSGFEKKDPDSERVLNEPLITYRDTHIASSIFLSIFTLSWRYLVQSIRNPVYLLLLLFFPTCTLTVIFLTVGRPPKDIPVAWIVEDSAEYGVIHAVREKYSEAYETYQIPFYPDVIKSQLDPKLVNLEAYEKLEDAIEDIKKQRLKAALVMRAGFSEALHSRANPFSITDIDDRTIRRGTLEVYGDVTNRFTMLTVELCLEYALFKTINITAPAFNASYLSRQFPVQLGEVVEGSLPTTQGLDMAEFAAPGFIMATLFSCGFGLSCLAFMAELKSKMIERNLSTGISSFQLIISQAITRFILFSPNAFILLCLTLYGFKIPFRGSITLAIILICLQNLSGIVCGILFAAMFPRFEHAIFTSIAIYLLILDTSGLFWPLQALPYFIHYLSLVSPFTAPNIALQSIFVRSNPSYAALIWPGFYTSIVWIVMAVLLSLLVLKIKI